MDYDGASTGVDGRFKLARIKPNTNYSLEFQYVGFQTRNVADVPAGRENLEVTMVRCGGIAGALVDAQTGEPVQDFGFLVNRMDEEAEAKWWDHKPTGEIIHSEDGTFSIDGQQAGEYALFVFAANYEDYEQQQIMVDPEKTTQLATITLNKKAD